MPYIPMEARRELESGKRGAANAGELNYQITRLVDEYLCRIGKSYQTINDILGAMEGSKLELYRRVAAPYEDRKITDNGEVYGSIYP